MVIIILITGIAFDVLYFNIFGSSGGAAIYLAVVVYMCTQQILNKLRQIFEPGAKKQSLVKKLTHRLNSEISNGREPPTSNP